MRFESPQTFFGVGALSRLLLGGDGRFEQAPLSLFMSSMDASTRPGSGLHGRFSQAGRRPSCTLQPSRAAAFMDASAKPGGGLHARFGQAQPRLRPGPRAGALRPCGLRRASRPAACGWGLGSASGCAARLKGKTGLRPLAPGAGQISDCPQRVASALSQIDVEPKRSTCQTKRSQPQRPA